MQAPESQATQLNESLISGSVLKTTIGQWFGEAAGSNVFDFAEAHSAVKSRQPETFSVRDLKERGWTKTMMDLFLSTSDMVQPSGVTAGRPKQLYLKSHILSIEAKDSFKARCLAAMPRRESSNAIFNEKSELLIAMVTHYRFALPDMAVHDLRLQTIQKYGEMLMPTDQLRNEIQFLAEPIELACSELHAFSWNYGVREARQVLRKRIYVAVMEKYPHLSRTIFRLCRDETL